MPFAWSYARTSTVRQAAADRSGMGRQAEALDAWLAAHPGYELAERLLDAGVSAGRGKHRKSGALSRFIEGGRSGAVPPGSVLVVESLTRFSREAERSVLETLLRDVWGQGLAIAICADGGVVLTGELIDQEPHRLYGLLGSISQARREWEERSRRSKGAANKACQLQDQGIRTGHATPWWISRSSKGEFFVDPAARAVIERAVELALAGQGTTLIAAILNQEGWPPPPTQTRRNQYSACASGGWTHGRISSMFRRSALIGTLLRQDTPAIPGYYPPVLSEERWAELRTALDGRSKLKSQLRGGRLKCHNLFQTLARCAICGSPASYHPPGRGARKDHPGWIGCRLGNSRSSSGCTNHGYIFTDEFENHCLTRLQTTVWEALLARPEDAAEQHKLEQHLGELAIQKAQLQQHLEGAENRAEEAWLDNVDAERQATIERVLKRLRQQLEAAATGHDKLAQQLAVLRSRPTGSAAALELRSRVADAWKRLRSKAVSDEELTERLVRVQEVNGEPSPPAKVLAERVAQLREAENIPAPNERRDFNRWLLTREPAIRFQLHPDRKVELTVGDESLGVKEIQFSDLIVVESGAVGVDLDEPFPGGKVITHSGREIRSLQEVIDTLAEAGALKRAKTDHPKYSDT